VVIVRLRVLAAAVAVFQMAQETLSEIWQVIQGAAYDKSAYH
jgi:hypothetical protein